MSVEYAPQFESIVTKARAGEKRMRVGDHSILRVRVLRFVTTQEPLLLL